MPVDQDERPTFFQEQYLGPEDLNAAVDYGRIQLARHSLGAHTWGIAIGLQLIEKPSPAGNNAVDVFLEPGYAWDGFGREIVVLAPYKIPAALFQNIVYDGAIDDPTKSGDTKPGRPVKIWLSYTEQANQPPVAGFASCNGTGQTSRVQETFTLQVGELVNASDQRDPVSIGGKTVDAQQALITFDPTADAIYDASIPQQALPEDNAQALWLIPVGYVRWLPPQTATQTGAFQQRTGPDLTRSNAARQYIGVVAETLEAAAKHVQVKQRGAPFSTISSEDLLWVEGPMRVEGNASLYKGCLLFVEANGQDNGVPLLLQRATGIDPLTNATITSLQIEIGSSSAGNNMLSVGPVNAGSGKLTPVFNVLDSQKAGVGTTTPRNALGVRGLNNTEELLSFEDASGATKWHVNQKANGIPGLNFAETGVADFRLFLQPGGNIGIGTQTPSGRLTLTGIIQPAQGNITFFSQTSDIEYDGGNDQLFLIRATGSASTAFIGGKIGVGTTTPSNTLHVSDPNGIRQGRLFFSGDAGWQSLTYNAYHDAPGSAWVFPDPTRPAVTIEMDDAGGRGRFEVWSTTTAAKTGWLQRLRIDGETGNVGINTGLTGISGKLTIVSDVATQGAASFFTAASDFEYDGGSDRIFVFRGLANAKTVFAGGNFGINVANPGVALDVSGDVNLTGDITANGTFYPSDLRLKRNVETLAGALDQLLRLRGVSFLWRDPEKHGGRSGTQIGLIAQDVEAVFPDWVKESQEGDKLLGHRGLEALLIEAIRELKQRVDQLGKEIKSQNIPETL